MKFQLKTTRTTAPGRGKTPPAVPDPLNHVMMLDDVEHYIGDHLLSVETILFNGNRIPPEEALRIVRAGEYSPYVLAIPKEQFYGLFKDQPIYSADRVQSLEPGRGKPSSA